MKINRLTVTLFVAILGIMARHDRAFAQSGTEVNAWARWCSEQGGTVRVTSSTPICDPAPVDASSHYSANEQAILNLAGQFGSTLGNAIRESLQRSAERQQRLIMQQEWEEERARQQASEEYEQQRLRNENLIAHMHGAIANPNDPASALSHTQLGTETLRLRSADQMFNRGGEQRDTVTQEVPISAPLDLAEMQAAQQAYFDALDDANDADQEVLEAEAYLERVRSVRAEAQHQQGNQHILLAGMASDSPERPATQAYLAYVESTLPELQESEEVGVAELAEKRAAAARAREALRTAQQRRAAFGASTAAPSP